MKEQRSYQNNKESSIFMFSLHSLEMDGKKKKKKKKNGNKKLTNKSWINE